MRSDGKQLEALVSFVEKMLVPPGFQVTPNSRIFNEEGVQIAEFDIEIRGKVGSTSIAWLIECRDRPGKGAAPGAWIEQLVGRRDRFNFNKVTAVSTTGFAAGAVDYARRSGIELREVRNLDPESFEDWLQILEVSHVNQFLELKNAKISIGSSEAEEVRVAAMRLIGLAKPDDAVLVMSLTQERISIADAFNRAMETQPSAFDSVTVDRPRIMSLIAQYSRDDYFYIETDVGNAKVWSIEFLAQLRIEEIKTPVISTIEYRHVENGEVISRLATFAPNSVLGLNFSLVMHRMGEDGERHVFVRCDADEQT